MRTQRAREWNPSCSPPTLASRSSYLELTPIGWNQLPRCPVLASACHLSLVCLQISPEMLLQTKWIGYSRSTCHFEKSLGYPPCLFCRHPGVGGALQWPHWDKQYWGWLRGLFTWKFTSGVGGGQCFADVLRNTVSLRTTQNTLVDQNTFIFLLATCQVHCQPEKNSIAGG